jgi:hypothetical protein
VGHRHGFSDFTLYEHILSLIWIIKGTAVRYYACQTTRDFMVGMIIAHARQAAESHCIERSEQFKTKKNLRD